MADENVRWTAKLPALVAGIVLLVIGLGAAGRKKTIAAVIALTLGAAFVGYSYTIKNWCALQGTTWGQTGFSQGGWGGGFGECLRQKGWLSF